MLFTTVLLVTDTGNTRSSPALGAVPPQFAAVFILVSEPAPVQVRVAANACGVATNTYAEMPNAMTAARTLNFFIFSSLFYFILLYVNYTSARVQVNMLVFKL